MTALYHGLQLQLMVYLDAAVGLEAKRHPGQEVIPAGVFTTGSRIRWWISGRKQKTPGKKSRRIS